MPNPQTEVQIKDLRPVEAYLLMNPRKYKLDECFRLIFVDLILRGVLGYREVVHRVSPLSVPAKFYQVYQGINFTDNNLLYYERFFLKPLTKEGENQALWISPYGHELVKNALEGRKQLPLDIILSAAISRWITFHWSNWFTGWLQLNKPGKQVAEIMRRRLIHEIPDLVPDHKYKQLTSLGSGFILLSVDKYRPDWFTKDVVAHFLKHEYELNDSASKAVINLMFTYQVADYFYAETPSYDPHHSMDDDFLFTHWDTSWDSGSDWDSDSDSDWD